MSKLRLAVVAFIACLVASQAVAQADYTIRVSGGSGQNRGVVRQIGPWSMTNPTLTGAVEVFGAPSFEQAVRPGFGVAAYCAVTWEQIGLRVVFTTLGLNPGPCNPELQVRTASVSSKQWRTGSGLRVGDPKSRIFKLNPNAKFRNGAGWVLFTKYWPFGPNAPTRIPSVSATVSHGRIAAFRLYIDAQGE